MNSNCGRKNGNASCKFVLDNYITALFVLGDAEECNLKLYSERQGELSEMKRVKHQEKN